MLILILVAWHLKIDDHDLAFRAGIDGSSVFKELFTTPCKEAFDTNRGLWLATKQNELYPNPHSYAKESMSNAKFLSPLTKHDINASQLGMIPFHWSNSWRSTV